MQFTNENGQVRFHGEAGKTYRIITVSGAGNFNGFDSWGDSSIETMFVNGTWTSVASGDFIVYLNGETLVNFGIDGETFTPETIESMINTALNSVKTYVDSKDESVKTYAQSLVEQLVQTTDLQAKLDLLAEINSILDGDTATAGFQLWESNVLKLNQLVVDVENLGASVQANWNGAVDMNATTNARIQTAENEATLLDSRVTSEIHVLTTNIAGHFSTLKSKAAIIFAV